MKIYHVTTEVKKSINYLEDSLNKFIYLKNSFYTANNNNDKKKIIDHINTKMRNSKIYISNNKLNKLVPNEINKSNSIYLSEWIKFEKELKYFILQLKENKT